ncbi:MAG: hypothetical protein JWO06_2775 [Bacteroidota bacterium]|nr:hypothetical protein [Bacteroidota bacterium]
MHETYSMKNIFTSLIALFTMQFLSAQYCGNSGPAVCTPVTTGPLGAFVPTPDSLPPILNGSTCSTVLHFKNFNVISFGGQSLTIQSLKIDTIANLPNGLCWATNKANNTWLNQEDGCVALSGTCCSLPGQYLLYIIVDANVGVAITTNMAACGVHYYMRVNNLGDPITQVDTMVTAPFQQYGTEAPVCAACACNTNYSGPLAVTMDSNQTVCNGSNIILHPNINGGQPPYSFSWQGTGSSLNCPNCQNPSVTLTQNSSYTVTVTDATNATATGTISYTVSGSGNIPQVSYANTNLVCNSLIDTSTLTITGGSSPYQVRWGDGAVQSGGFVQSHIYQGSGVFLISVRDNAGCVIAGFDSIQNLGVTISLLQAVSPNCNGQNTGKAVVTASAGSAPYTFRWSNGAVTDSIVNVTAGTYRVTATDINSCSATYNEYLSPVYDAYYYVYLNSTAANCGNNGTIVPSVAGGISPLSYAWSNADTTHIVANLAGGLYYLTVTDSAGCQAIGNTIVNSTCVSVVSGNIFIDSNNNCLRDGGEQGSANVMLTISGNGQQYFAMTDGSGNYSFGVNGPGIYTLAPYFNFYGGSQCANITLCGNSAQTVTIAANGDSSLNNNFALYPSTGFDLTMHPGWTSANPGFQKEYWTYPFNGSSSSFNGPAIVVFTYDSNLVYQYSNAPLPVHNPTAHTLTWVIDTVPSPNFFGPRYENFFLVPSTLPSGYLLQSDFLISPSTGDCDSSNNHFHFSETVIGSHDPNDKVVEPANTISESDSVLTYTIHFQNTGTDYTHFIIVKDTLSANLDPGTVRNIASSHKYSSFDISGRGILTWTFNPLRLADSIADPEGSKGFIMFQVKKKKNIPVGSSISNTASVYFDYNSAVVTNTVTDTVTNTIFTSEARMDNGVSVKAFPNPFTSATNIVVTGLTEKFDFELFDMTGRIARRISSVQNNQLQLNRNELSAGVYLYRILVNTKQLAYGRLVVE